MRDQASRHHSLLRSFAAKCFVSDTAQCSNSDFEDFIPLHLYIGLCLTVPGSVVPGPVGTVNSNALCLTVGMNVR